MDGDRLFMYIFVVFYREIDFDMLFDISLLDIIIFFGYDDQGVVVIQ